jgi:hypothetical protein
MQRNYSKYFSLFSTHSVQVLIFIDHFDLGILIGYFLTVLQFYAITFKFIGFSTITKVALKFISHSVLSFCTGFLKNSGQISHQKTIFNVCITFALPREQITNKRFFCSQITYQAKQSIRYLV